MYRLSSHTSFTVIKIISKKDISSILVPAQKQSGVRPCPGGLPWWLRCKQSACRAGDQGSIPGLGRSPGEGHGYPLPYSCIENSLDRGAWWTKIRGVEKSRTPLSDYITSAQTGHEKDDTSWQGPKQPTVVSACVCVRPCACMCWEVGRNMRFRQGQTSPPPCAERT